MSHIIDRIRKMDIVYVGMESLKEDLKSYDKADFSDEWRKLCLNHLEEIKKNSMDLNLEITALLDKIQELIVETEDVRLYNMVYSFVEKTQEIFNKSYLKYIYSEDSYKEDCVENYYGTEYEKNALLVYLLQPFLISDMIPGHTNQVEARIIAETLSEKGYNVDLINTRYVGEVDSSKYSLIIGEGKVFEKLCRSCSKDTRTVYYLTRACSYFSNMAELKRIRDFEKRNHYMPRFERFTMDLLDIPLLTGTNAAICLGNEHTISTYQGIFKKIYPLNVTGFSEYQLPCINKKRTAKNFLWYGGAGPIHKGLDLCIEAFRNLPDLNLYIVGELSSEFYDFYKEDIEHKENILYYGFLRKDSELFLEVCEECDFCIFPSCSEGQSTAVISTMFAGIIPVCTKETGIDVERAGGFVIADIAVDALGRLIRSLSALDPIELEVRQKKVYEYTAANHTAENYKRNLSRIMEDILQ